MQILAVVMMLYRAPLLTMPVYGIGLVLLYLAAALTLWSMLVYLRAAWPELWPGSPAPDRRASLDRDPPPSTMISPSERE